MRLAPLVLALALAASGCARNRVSLDAVHGIATTHFEGLPDQSRICAVLSNRGETEVDWVRLRLRAWSRYEDRRSRWTSHWVLTQPLAPGQSAAVELENPPAAEEIELAVRTSGRGRVPPGRPLRSSEECSEQALARAATAEQGKRTAAGLELRALALRDPINPRGAGR